MGGAGVCTDVTGAKIKYCQNYLVTEKQCEDKCSSMPNCQGFSRKGVCLLFFVGPWRSPGWETFCSYYTNENGIAGADASGGGVCYRKDWTVRRLQNASNSATSIADADTIIFKAKTQLRR